MIRPTALLFVLTLGTPFVFAEDWKARLSSNDPGEVYQAIERLAAAKDASAAPALIEAAMLTQHAHIAVACGEALAALGPSVGATSVVQTALHKAEAVKDPEGQKNLARMLGTWGDKVIDEPMGFLASGRRSAEVQVEALFMCGNVVATKNFGFPRIVESVTQALEKGRTEGIKMAACSAAGRLNIQALIEPLVDVVRKSQDKYTGLYATWALNRLGARGDLGRYLHIIDGGTAKSDTIRACLKAVTDLSGPDDIEPLLELTRSPKKDSRDAACIALGRLATLGPIGGAVPVVTGEGKPVTGGTPPGPSKVIERMIQIIETDDDWEVRDAASRTLMRIGEPAKEATSAKMPDLIDSSDDDIALTAMELCGRFKATAASKALLKIAHVDKNPTKRMFAARAAGEIDGDAAATDVLEDVAKDRKGREQTIWLVRALGYIRSEKAYDGLVAMFSVPEYSQGVLHEAETALERLTGHRFGRKPERWKAWYAKKKGRDPFQPHLGKYDRTKNRREAVEKKLYGMTETTERSVEAGLRFLEGAQHPEGFWDGNEKGFGGVVSCEPAYTGLSLLAFLGAGYNGKSGRYHETIRRASEFLAATQYYDGGFPVTGGGDNSWIFAYLIGMAVWGLNESYALSGDEFLRGPAQRGIDYLVRVQTPGGGWRYGPRYTQSDTSCTSWVLMTMKTATLLGLDVPQKAYDGADSWLERCAYDISGQEEVPDDLKTKYEQEVGAKRYYKAFTGYFVLSGNEASALQQTSMTAAGMVCRFFSGWKRSHPFLIGSANYLRDYLPQWRKGLEKGQAIAWYFYYWYYGTLAMHQMGGSYWRQWNEKIKTMLPENQRQSPPESYGSWDPDSAVLNGGRLFSTAIACLTLETYYRFSPLLESDDEGPTPPK